MDLLEKRIAQDGEVTPGNILKVNSFLNHQIDVSLLDKMGAEFKRLFSDVEVTKVLTVEASGIAVAYPVAREFNVPLVFAKKHQSSAVNEKLLSSVVWSYTTSQYYTVVASRKFINPEDKILLVDDFLANGCALGGLIDLVEQAGATVSGICIAIEKGFQEGGKLLRERGYRLESLAIIDKMKEDGTIQFRAR